MKRIVAIGEQSKLASYALAGVELIEAEAPAGIREAWEQLADDVGLVLLTPEARHALPDSLGRPEVLRAVLPA